MALPFHPQPSRACLPSSQPGTLDLAPSSRFRGHCKSPSTPICSPILQIRIPSQFRRGWRGGGCRGGGGPPQPEIGREGLWIPGPGKGGTLFSLPRPLVFVWAGGPMEASFTQGHILQIGPPSPPPVGTLLCQLDCDNKRHPLPRLPSPSKRKSGGWGVGVPRGPRGPRNLTYRRQRPRPEPRAGAAAAAAAGSAWCGLMQAAAPYSRVLLLLTVARPPPQLGGPPFSSFPPPLFLSYLSATRTRGVGEEAEFGAPCEGSADEGTPPDPKSKPFTPGFSLRSSFPRPWAKLTAPSPSRLRLQKCTIGRRQGGGWGRGPGWGALGRGLMELWGLPSFPPPPCTGLELAPLFPRLRCRGAG